MVLGCIFCPVWETIQKRRIRRNAFLNRFFTGLFVGRFLFAFSALRTVFSETTPEENHPAPSGAGAFFIDNR